MYIFKAKKFVFMCLFSYTLVCLFVCIHGKILGMTQVYKE